MLTIDGKPCVNPTSLFQACTLSDPPLSTAWYGEANRYFNPIGLSPGYGKLLLKRQTLDELLTEPHAPRRLIFAEKPELGNEYRVEIPNIRLCGNPLCLTPGSVRHPEGVYLVDITDRRIDCEGLTSKRYNWRVDPASSVQTNTLNGASEWTWTQLIQDLWNAVGELGDFPGLPVDPIGLSTDTPSQIDCHAFRAADALEDVLTLNGLAVSYDPVRDKFSIVYLSQFDQALRATDVALRNAGLRIGDDDKHDGGICESPEYARVLFPIWTAEGDSADPKRVYAIDVRRPDNTLNPRVGTFALIQDYRPCRLNSAGTIQDSAGMLTRASVAARVYFDRLWTQNHADPLNTVYSGYHKDQPFLRHNSLDCIGWQDYGEGPMTIVMRSGRQGVSPLYALGLSSPLTSGSILSDITSFTPVRVRGGNAGNGWRRGGGLPPTPRESRMDRMGERP